MLLSLFCYLKLQKSWSAFNFYSNALSAVTFSLRALFSPCQFSLHPSRFAQFRLNDWLVNGLGSSPLLETDSSASVFRRNSSCWRPFQWKVALLSLYWRQICAHRYRDQSGATTEGRREGLHLCIYLINVHSMASRCPTDVQRLL